MQFAINISYIIAAILFIFGIKMLGSAATAVRGNRISSLGMLIAIITTVYLGTDLDFTMIGVAMIIGSVIGAFFFAFHTMFLDELSWAVFFIELLINIYCKMISCIFNISS